MTLKKHYDAGTLSEEEWLLHASATAHVLNSPGGKRICEQGVVIPSVLKVFREFENAHEEQDGLLLIDKYRAENST